MLASLFCGLARKQYLEELSGIAQLLGFDANMVAGVIVEAGETSAAPFKPPHGRIEYTHGTAPLFVTNPAGEPRVGRTEIPCGRERTVTERLVISVRPFLRVPI
jgi:hypothetical protein